MRFMILVKANTDSEKGRCCLNAKAPRRKEVFKEPLRLCVLCVEITNPASLVYLCGRPNLSQKAAA